MICLQALLSFQIDSVDVLTNAFVTAKIAACGMYMCILPQLTATAAAAAASAAAAAAAAAAGTSGNQDLLGEDGKERKASSRRSLLSTATEHALQRKRSFGVVDGVTISFSVRCNDDCYRASLTMHTDVASLSNSATLLQCMVFACVSSTVDGSRLC